jgi:ABC-type molybdate transport system ATPase subunit
VQAGRPFSRQPAKRAELRSGAREVRIVPLVQGEAIEAMVEQLVHRGREVHVQLKLDDGRELWAQLTRERAHELELGEGEIFALRLPSAHLAA